MVKRHIDQMIRTRNFKVRYERIETGVLVKTQGKTSPLKGEQENAISAKQKRQRSKGDSCSFRHDDNQRGNTIVLCCTQIADTRKRSQRKQSTRKETPKTAQKLPWRAKMITKNNSWRIKVGNFHSKNSLPFKLFRSRSSVMLKIQKLFT